MVRRLDAAPERGASRAPTRPLDGDSARLLGDELTGVWRGVHGDVLRSDG